MASRTVTIPDHLGKEIDDAIAAGEYASTEDALADAIARWARRHEDAAEDLAWLKASLNASMNDPRPTFSMDEVRAHMKAFIANTKTRPDEAA